MLTIDCGGIDESGCDYIGPHRLRLKLTAALPHPDYPVAWPTGHPLRPAAVFYIPSEYPPGIWDQGTALLFQKSEFQPTFPDGSSTAAWYTNFLQCYVDLGYPSQYTAESLAAMQNSIRSGLRQMKGGRDWIRLHFCWGVDTLSSEDIR